MDFHSKFKSIERTLKKRAFVGHYVERRLANEELGYRDVVWLAPEETELVEDLQRACEVCRSISPSSFPSYRPDPPALWAQLMETPFGCHWFQISAVSFQENELSFHLRSLRYFPGVKYQKLEKYGGGAKAAITVEEIWQALGTNVQYILRNASWLWLLNTFRFLVVLFTTLTVGLFQLIFFLGDLTIKLTRELHVLTDASTPFLLGCLELVSKVIGGFYILLAMLWRGSRVPPAAYFAPALPPAVTRRRGPTPVHPSWHTQQ